MHVQGLPPPRLTALLGHARHTRLAPNPLTKVLFAPHVHVCAPTPLTLPPGQGEHEPPPTAEYELAGHGRMHVAPTPEPAWT